MMKSFGHESILGFFETAIQRDLLNHAYAFFGPTHVGKRTVAEDIARNILHIPYTHSFTHPDLIIIEREIDEKTGARKKDISIVQIRDLIHRMSQSSFTKDGYTIAIIDGAEYLNLSGANALLKSLEEPRTRTVIFLITQDETLLLPTIRSRVQSLYFSPVSQRKIFDNMIAQGVEQKHAENLAYESHGLPGYACMWAADTTLYEAYIAEKQRCQELTFLPFYEKLQKIEDFFENKDDHIEARTRIIDALRVWTFTLRDMMVNSSESRIKIFPTLDLITQAEKDLKRNIHPRLILEHILLALPHI